MIDADSMTGSTVPVTWAFPCLGRGRGRLVPSVASHGDEREAHEHERKACHGLSLRPCCAAPVTGTFAAHPAGSATRDLREHPEEPSDSLGSHDA